MGAEKTPKPRKPIVNARPLAVLTGNAAVIAGSTLVAAGGLPALAAGTAAAALTGGAAVAGKKTAARRAATRTARAATAGAARSGGRSAGTGLGGRSRKAAGGAGAGARSGRLASAARSLGRKVGIRSAGAGAGTRKGGAAGAGATGAGAGKRSGIRSALPRVFRSRSAGAGGRSGTGAKPSGIRKALGAPLRSARATRKALAPTARKVGAGAKRTATGMKRAAVGTGAGFRWLRNMWRKATGRKPLGKKTGTGATPGKVNDPHRKTTGPKMATAAPVPPAPPRPMITAQPSPRKLPHAERIANMSTAAIRMQELADEMLAVSRQYAYAMDEKGSGVGLLAYASDCAAIPGILQTVAAAIHTRHEMAESLPISSVVPEAQQEVHQLQLSVAGAAEAAWGLLEAVEADKLATLRNPHPNQHKAETAENAEV